MPAVYQRNRMRSRSPTPQRPVLVRQNAQHRRSPGRMRSPARRVVPADGFYFVQNGEFVRMRSPRRN